VRRYLDCGLYENGFARVRCPDCRAEYLLAFPCKTRELCPSCAARRAAATAALLREEVLEEVGHAQWVFVMPKMLRPYFLHHRELLGGLARAAWETVRELMVAATGEEDLRPGMVAVVQTAGDLANWHPHVHGLVSRGGWTRDWQWIPLAYVDESAAELLFRHKVMRMLQEEGLLTEERTELLLSWGHKGFSVHNRVRVEPEDGPAVERLARYIMRPPISLQRIRWRNARCSISRREVTTAAPGSLAIRPRPSARPSFWPGSSCTSQSRGVISSGTTVRTRMLCGASVVDRARPPSVSRLAMASMLLQFGLTEIAAPAPALSAGAGPSSSSVSRRWTRRCAQIAVGRCASLPSSSTTMSWTRSCDTS
jgi:hypothetical protein